jgi:UDP-2,3-diacylglucosamine pyrophosphatase LpxH
VYEALKYKKIDYLVINGDAVELDWGSYYSFKKVMIENAKLFKNLSVMFPKIKIIYILGNHDGYIEFYQILTSLAETTENFEVKPSFLRLGNTLFHHGDLMVKLGNELYRDKGDLKKLKTDFTKRKLKKLNDNFLTHKIKTPTVEVGYNIVQPMGKDVLGNPNASMINFIKNSKKLDIDIMEGIEKVVVGHSHIPLYNYDCGNGILLSNSGATTKGKKFNPLIGYAGLEQFKNYDQLYKGEKIEYKLKSIEEIIIYKETETDKDKTH